MKQLQRKVKSGRVNVNEENPFEMFVASTNIRYCYYSETQKILGNTYGMCVLQVGNQIQITFIMESILSNMFKFS